MVRKWINQALICMNKKTIWAAVIGIVLIGASFYGGYAYAKSSAPSRTFTRGQFAGAAGAGAAGAGFAGRGAGAGGGFTAGTILSTGNGSITVKLSSGSTQIVLVATSTQVMKSASGSLADLTAGTNVVVTGTTNSDQSITASSIQLRPAGMGVSQGRGSSTASQ